MLTKADLEAPALLAYVAQGKNSTSLTPTGAAARRSPHCAKPCTGPSPRNRRRRATR